MSALVMGLPGTEITPEKITGAFPLRDRRTGGWRLAGSGTAGGGELSGVVPHGNSPEAQLVVSIRSLFEKEQTDRLSSEVIVCALAEAQNSVGSNRPSFTKAQLARRLAPLGIRPTIVYRTRNQVRRGYLLKDFRVASEQYWDSVSRSPL
jgi:hypothetical protein